jgi:hypothetical protein
MGQDILLFGTALLGVADRFCRAERSATLDEPGHGARRGLASRPSRSVFGRQTLAGNHKSLCLSCAFSSMSKRTETEGLMDQETGAGIVGLIIVAFVGLVALKIAMWRGPSKPTPKPPSRS